MRFVVLCSARAPPSNLSIREQTTVSELKDLRTEEETLQRVLPHLSVKEQARVRSELSAIRQQIGLFTALGFETDIQFVRSDEEPDSAA